MWSGRFEQPPDPEFEQWQRSFPYDKRLLHYEVAASKAHARGLAKLGVLSAAELETVLAGLDRIGAEGAPAVDPPEIEDVHHWVEKRLIDVAGEVGYKLHTGRSRNEQIATDLRLFVRDQIDAIAAVLAEFVGAAVEQAERAGEAVMPSYTHLQRAEPVLIAHWLLAYGEMFWRDIERLHDCRARMNYCPLGSGAIAGAILPLDREAIARDLGFTAPTRNSMDATSDRDFAIEFVQALSLAATHLSRWAEDLVLYSTQEFAFIVLPERYSTGSSAMPQKKNPDALEIIRSKAGRITSNAIALLTSLKGLPMAYNKDLQETQQPIFDAAEQALQMMRVAARFMAAVEWNFERTGQAATTGGMNAFAAAGYLVRAQGVPFRRAHEVIGAAVRVCVAKGCELDALSAEEFERCGIRADEGFYQALTTQAVLAAHDVEGGTAPERVKAAIAAMKKKLEENKGQHACA